MFLFNKPFPLLLRRCSNSCLPSIDVKALRAAGRVVLLSNELDKLHEIGREGPSTWRRKEKRVFEETLISRCGVSPPFALTKHLLKV